MITALHLNVGHRLPLVRTEIATFIAGMGIESDRHCTDKQGRDKYQVLLIEQETLETFGLLAGDVRENVTTTGVNLSAMKDGQLLTLGDEVILIISKPCVPCSRLDEIRPGLHRALDGKRGMLASVHRGGVARVGDHEQWS